MRVTWFDLVTPVTFGKPKRPPGSWGQLVLVTAGLLALPAGLVVLAVLQLGDLDGVARWLCLVLAAVAVIVMFRYILVATVTHERAVRTGKAGPHAISRGVGFAAGMAGASLAPLLPAEAAVPLLLGTAGGIAPLTMIWVLRLPSLYRRMRLPV